jgi:DNA topoisomerase-1
MPGKYGPYIKWGKVNATLPKEISPEAVSLEAALALVAEKAGKSGKKPPVRKATAQKPSAKVAGATKRAVVKKPAAQKSPEKKPAAKKPTARKLAATAGDVLE